jgi:hypothetical protein
MIDLSTLPRYTPENWFWKIGTDSGRWYSSAAAAYVTELPASAGVTTIGSEADLWAVLADRYPAGLPAGDAAAQDVRKERELDRADRLLFLIAFRQENRVRALEGKQPITAAQFRAAVKDAM